MNQALRSAPQLPAVVFRLRDQADAERLVELSGATTEDCAGSLAALIGTTGDRLIVDGRGIDRGVPLRHAGLTEGSLVEVSPDSESATPADAGPLRPGIAATLTWVGGADAGRTVPLPPGRWIVGRSPTADLHADDPQLATHQGVLTIDHDARVTYCDIGIGRPATLAGELITGIVVVPPSTSLTVGASTFVIHAAGLTSSLIRTSESSPDLIDIEKTTIGAVSPWKQPLHRPPRQQPVRQIPDVELPDMGGPDHSFASGIGLISMITTLGGGIAMAIVFHQLLLMIMVGVGAVGALITWSVQAVKRRRGRGRSQRRSAIELQRFAESLQQHRLFTESSERTVGIDLLRAVERRHGDPRLWEVRSADGDAFTVELGIGDRRYQPLPDGGAERIGQQAVEAVAAHSLLRQVPIRATLSAGCVLGVCGDRHAAVSVVRSMICQLSVVSGPADWMLVVLSSPSPVECHQPADPSEHRWEWTRWLPQVCRELTEEAELAGVCEAAAATGRRVVVVVDHVAHLSTRTTPLRRAMNAPSANLCVITVADQVSSLSSLCTEILHANLDGSATWQPVAPTGDVVQRLRLVGASATTAEALAARLARYEDPELHQAAGSQLGDVDLMTLLDGTAASAGAIADGWRRGGSDIAPSGLIGQSSTGAIEINLVRDGPHGLIAGTTGAGKSELLRTVVTALAVTCPPEQLSFVLIDYKGGAAFDGCSALPHVVGLVTDLDEHLAARVLRSLDAEIRRREQVLRSVGAADLAAYRLARHRLRVDRSAPTTTGPGHQIDASRAPELSRLVIVVDEFAAMAAEIPGFLSSLVSVAQRGRSLGMHLLLATQRPAGVVSDDIRANTNMRIALRVHDASDSTDVISDSLAATLPRRWPGRAVIRLGVDELEIFQTARCTGAAPANPTSGLRLQVLGPSSELLHQPSGGPPACGRLQPPASLSPSWSVPLSEESTGDGPAHRKTLDVLVERITAAVQVRQHEPPHRPWLDPLPEVLPRSELTGDAIGLVDLPDEQRRGELTWAPEQGHLVIAGALGSGTTTALISIALHAAERSGPRALHIYVLDAAGSTLLDPLGGLSHCAGVVRVSELERRARLLDRLRQRTVMQCGCGEGSPGGLHGRHSSEPRILLLIDGLGALRAQLIESGLAEELIDLERIVADGPSAGIAVAATIEQASALPAGMSSRVSTRWVLRVGDRSEAIALGVPGDAWPVRMPPGRGVIGGSGLEFQLGIDTVPIDDVVATINERHADSRQGRRSRKTSGRTAAHAGGDGCPQPIAVLSTDIDFGDLARPATAASGGGAGVAAGVGIQLAFGQRSDDLSVAALRLFDGEHAVVAGTARSGRTNALATLATSWRIHNAGGWLGVIAPRSAGMLATADVSCSGSAALVASHASALQQEKPGMLIVDDADLVDDDDGLLQQLVSTHRAGFHVIVAGRVETLRGYGHWTASIKRSRKGLLLGPLADIDGDMLGVFLPRRSGATPLPGRGYLVTDSQADLVQVARLRPPIACDA